MPKRSRAEQTGHGAIRANRRYKLNLENGSGENLANARVATSSRKNDLGIGTLAVRRTAPSSAVLIVTLGRKVATDISTGALENGVLMVLKIPPK